ncbi:tetratricopeptide repeat protein [Endozoicomonas sp. 4G]|uniref:tetratricopeptide repeat protein n=1 Tax=Endozoicomonas sp. 4G TaxID=2872754 RepID=UPI002078BC41|nr:tetratricopeptide repeat protein [Endozoicomonas sp. 4G]
MQKPFFLTVSQPCLHKYKAKWFVFLSAVLFAHAAVAEGQVSNEDPAVCQKFQPPQSESGQLVDWLLRHSLEMKREGCWQAYIQLGPQAMREAAMQSRFEDQVRIALTVASIYFYRGDYDQSRKVAEEACNYAQEHEEWDGYIFSLSQLSAVARAQGRKEAAMEYSEKGMEALEKYRPVGPFLEAKMLYNYGALLSDSDKPDLDRARIVLKRSLALYEVLKDVDEIVRANLRLARIDYLEGKYDRALAVIESVEAIPKSARSQMLYHYLLAKTHHRMEDWEIAAAEALRALALASRMNASEDEKRARALLTAIGNMAFVND